MPELPMKSQVFSALEDRIREELGAAERIAATARDEVSSDQTRQEGKYDTRATEASYLARGQAWRVAALRRLLAWFAVYDPSKALPNANVQVGAWVVLQRDQGPPEHVVLLPEGGASADIFGHTVLGISPTSPMGAAMAGLEVGDCFEVETPRGIVAIEITQVL
jgi:transcription elongation GreA/GreB family factor